MNNKKISASEKLLKFLLRVLGVLLVTMGLPFFPVGGFIFVILGILCFLPYRNFKKKEKLSIPQDIESPIIPPSPQPSANKPILESENHKVTGVSHYRENILNLASDNDEYEYSKKEIIDSYLFNTRLYKYEFYTTKTELIPEPTNPYDPKAIKVIIDGEHVGYIKSGSCSHILKLINENRIVRLDSEIYGGPYKILLINEDDEDDKGELEKDSSEFKIKVSLYTN